MIFAVVSSPQNGFVVKFKSYCVLMYVSITCMYKSMAVILNLLDSEIVRSS